MNLSSRPRPTPSTLRRSLSEVALKRACTAAVFVRGRAYAEGNAVAVIGEDSDPLPTLRALVRGTGVYETSVWIEEGVIAGECDCPNSRDGYFCKHKVAVALVWRNRYINGPEDADESAEAVSGPGNSSPLGESDKPDKLRKFLHSQSASILADKILDLAHGDHSLMRALQNWRGICESDGDATPLRALVNEILAVGGCGYISYRETRAYLRRAEAIVPLLEKARGRDPVAAAGLALHALRRSWAAMECIDDSDGGIGGLCEAIGSEWVAALVASGTQPAGFGNTYLRIQLESPFACFDQELLESAIGEAALGRYRQRLAECWRQARDAESPSRSVSTRPRGKRGPTGPEIRANARPVGNIPLSAIQYYYLAALEKMGDIDGALVVLRSDLSEPRAYRRITDLLEKHNRVREAFANAELGCKAFPRDEALQNDLLRCYVRDGWNDEAYNLVRRQFDRHPGVENFHRVLNAGIAAGMDSAELRAGLWRALEALELTELERRDLSPYPNLLNGRVAVRRRDVTLRVQILCAENRWMEACDLAQLPAACHRAELKEIAVHLDESQAQRSLHLLQRVFSHVMPSATTPYTEALWLVGEIIRRLDPVARAAWLASLRDTYRAKRNFIRDLPK